jgi:C-terminal processing protease CtpA/Prc
MEPMPSNGTIYSQTNYGFEKIERLAGNIGYLDLRVFQSGGFARGTVVGTMMFLENVDALIIDLRQNRGGHPGAVALIASYLFGPEPVHLFDIYDRRSEETQEWWTSEYIAGERLTDVDVYLLTSNFTFSGAEAFADSLKNLERVTIVGETTRGGAHLGGLQRINEHFSVNVPTGRVINPISGTNWEGVGVQPDVETSSDMALATAHLLALESGVSENWVPRIRAEATTAIEQLKTELAEEP